MRTLAIIAGLPLLVWASTAAAQPTPVGQDAAALGVAGVVALALGITLYAAPTGHADPSARHGRGGILLDDAARSALRLRAPDDRQLARTLSDVAMVGTMALAATDAIGVPLAQGDVNLSWQAGFAYSLSLGLTISLGELFKRTVDRARPYEGGCAADPSGAGCGTPNAYASFYSLHTSVAFASAAFSCTMHLAWPLYADGFDAVSCAASLLLATLTGALRIAADEHYLSDAVVAAVVGTMLGVVVPLLFLPGRTASILPVPPMGLGGVTFAPSVAIPF